MIEFHALQLSDIEIIVPLMQEFYAIDNYPMDAETTTKLFQTFIENENLGQAWLISHNNEILGYVILTYIFSFEYQGRIAFLDELYLNEKARNKGIGKATMAFVHEHARQKELRMLYLEIESHNNIAKNLYLASNFSIHKRQILSRSVKA